MSEQEIHLRLNEKTRREELVGLGDELIPDDRIIEAVANHRRIFPYVVRHLALNQYRKENPEYTPSHDVPPCSGLLGIMGQVRDDLLMGMGETQPQCHARIQAENMTNNVRPDRPPYFVR